MTPALYENLAVRFKPARAALIGLAVVAALVGALSFSRGLSWGSAMVLSGLGLAALWFHPRSGIGPRSTRRRSPAPSSVLKLSWPAAVFLDLWMAVGALWIVQGIWGLR